MTLKTQTRPTRVCLAAPGSPGATEAKQDFLSRCAQAKTADGMSETQAMSACAGAWNNARLAEFIDNNRARLSGDTKVTLEAASDGKPRRFSMLGYTGKVIDWGYWGKFVIDLAGIKAAKETMPALRQHDVSRIVGTIDTTEASDTGFMATGNFSTATADGREVLALADEGFPWQASIGVQARKILEIAQGSTHEVNGQTVEGPISVWMESEVFEVSFVPFGADDDTAAVSMERPAEQPAPNGQEVKLMNPKLRAMLERLGLSAQATDVEAQAFLEAMDDATIAKVALGAAAPAAPAPAKTEPVQAELSAAQVMDLQSRGAALGLAAEKVTGCIRDNVKLSAAQVTEKMVELAMADNPPSTPASVTGGRTEMEKFNAAAEHALSLRCGIKLEKVEPGANDLRGMTLRELSREYLQRMGINTHGMSNMTLAGSALGTVRLASTSDFPNILANVANKVAMDAYQEAPSTWQAWCATSSANDFKSADRVQLSEAPALSLINEDGEYTHGKFSEFKETNQLKTYGKAFRLTRQAIINDDLGMLTRIPRAFGAAATRRINDLVYAVLTSNQTMAYDDVALFHSDHGNLPSAAALSASSLGIARAAMRIQKGPGGATLNISPSYLLVPAALETTAEVILRSASLPDADKSSGVYNPWKNALTPVVEARLDALNPKSWFLAASASQVDTVEVLFLDGIQAPVIEETESMNVDGREYLVRLDVGVRALDHRGMLKNVGA